MNVTTFHQFFKECLEQQTGDSASMFDWNKPTRIEFIKGLQDNNSTSTMMNKEGRWLYSIPLAVFTFYNMIKTPSMTIDHISFDNKSFGVYKKSLLRIVEDHPMTAFILDDVTDDVITFRGGGTVSRVIVPTHPDKKPEIIIKTSSIVNVIESPQTKFLLRVQNTGDVNWYHILRGFECSNLKII